MSSRHDKCQLLHDGYHTLVTGNIRDCAEFASFGGGGHGAVPAAGVFNGTAGRRDLPTDTDTVHAGCTTIEWSPVCVSDAGEHAELDDYSEWTEWWKYGNAARIVTGDTG